MIPTELKELQQWVVWRREMSKGKETKVSYQPRWMLQINPQHRRASHSDPSHWTSYEEACEALERFKDIYEGVCFAFSPDDPYCGIDFDHCIVWENAFKPTAPGCVPNNIVIEDIIDTFDTYTEISPSHDGVHLIFKAQMPDNKGRRTAGIEIYPQARFFTMTGSLWHHRPIRDCQAELDDLMARLFPHEQPKPATSTPAPSAGGDVTYTRWQDIQISASADAEPPASKLMQLSTDANFKATFDHTRRTDDGSDSAYDMALARMAANAGWTDQEIVNLLIMHRRTRNLGKLDRLDYYQRTIFNLRTNEKYQKALTTLDDLALTAESGEGVDPSTHAVVADVIKQLTGLKILRYVQYGISPASYGIYLEGDHYIAIQKSADVRSQSTWQDIAQEFLGVAFLEMKRPKWHKFLQALSLIRECEDNPDGGIIEETQDALRNYMAYADAQSLQSVETGLFYKDDEDTYYFTKSGFTGWLAQTHHDLPRTGIMANLKGAGARPYPVSVQRPDGSWLRKNYWQIKFS